MVGVSKRKAEGDSVKGAKKAKTTLKKAVHITSETVPAAVPTSKTAKKTKFSRSTMGPAPERDAPKDNHKERKSKSTGSAKKQSKKKTAAAAAAEGSSDDDSDGELLKGLDEDMLKDDYESSDDEGTSQKPSFPAFIPKDDQTVAKRLEAAKADPKNDEGEAATLYIGRIPHGFYEDEMRGYFSQFGDVLRLRLSRNKQTGRSKHYGFLQFQNKEVANVVQETMNNYLIAGRLLQVRHVPSDRIHESTWEGQNQKFKVVPRHRLERLRNEKERTAEQRKRLLEKSKAKLLKKLSRAHAQGINYEYAS